MNSLLGVSKRRGEFMTEREGDRTLESVGLRGKEAIRHDTLGLLVVDASDLRVREKKMM